MCTRVIKVILTLNQGENTLNTTLATRMAESVLPPPKKFNIEATGAYVEWKARIESFNIYDVAVDLAEKSDSVQTATMLHCLGPAVQIIYRMLPGKKEKYEEVVEALEGYFAPKRNVVAERYKFRSRKQNVHETIDAYITSLRELVKTCEFGTLEDEMIRDQIVEKCYSERLKQRLLAEEELDLAKTLRIVRSAQSVNATKSVLIFTCSAISRVIECSRITVVCGFRDFSFR